MPRTPLFHKTTAIVLSKPGWPGEKIKRHVSTRYYMDLPGIGRVWMHHGAEQNEWLYNLVKQNGQRVEKRDVRFAGTFCEAKSSILAKYGF